MSRYASKSLPIELEKISASPTNAAGIPCACNANANFFPSRFVLVNTVISLAVT